MTDKKISKQQRLRIIRWHHAVCPDGHDQRSAAWKNRLAKQIVVSPSTITNWCRDYESTPRNQVLNRLGQSEDEEFIRILGFNFESLAPSNKQNALIQSFAGVRTEEEYAVVCLRAGAPLREAKRAAAQKEMNALSAAEGRRQAEWRPRDKACWWQRFDEQGLADAETGVPMHKSEHTSIREVFSTLSNGAPNAPVTVLHAKPHSGVSYALQRLLPAQRDFRLCFDGGIDHLHMGAIENISQTQAVVSRAILKTEESEHSPSPHRSVTEALARHLHVHRKLLIIHGATAANTGLPVPAKRAAYRFIEGLAEDLEKNCDMQSNKRVCRLLLTCWDLDTFYHLNNEKVRRVSYNPNIAGDQAITYFEQLLDYYGYARRMAEEIEQQGGAEDLNYTKSPIARLPKAVSPHPRPNSSLLKRIAHHYTGKSFPHTELPSAVRFRALCASDFGSPCTFDPTQGVWDRVGPTLRSGIPEIADCLTDIRSDIRTYGEHSPSDLMTLRLISTGLFFFSKNMLEKLKKHPLAVDFVSNTSFEPTTPFRKYVNLFRHDESGQVATMPLLVRSLIQDDWMRYQRGASRAAVHEAIGDILLDEATKKTPGALAMELPYAPPWGREDIALALEAIRHFMRAAASQSPEDAKRLTTRSMEIYENFLEPNLFVDADKEEKTRLRPKQKWALSRAQGLHGLKYEALCLLSEDGRGQRPPLGLDSSRIPIYFRELGITLTRMLRPKEALAAFRKAKTTPGVDNRTKAYLCAHEVMAHLMLGDISRAVFALHEAQEFESDARIDLKSRQQIRDRNKAREAAIEFAEGRLHTAISIWIGLAESRPTPFINDRVIGYVDSVLASNADWERDRAKVWRAAELASTHAHNEGLEHERLRLAIRRAAIARRLGFPSVAEAMLDQVGIDLGKNGGAEIVFREFQFESAVVLYELKRPKYAFSTYAWPAFVSLKNSDAAPWGRRAREICAKLLAVMEDETEEILPDFTIHPFWVATESFDLGLKHPFYSIDLLPPQSVVCQTYEDLADPEKRKKFSEEIGDIL